MRRLLVIDDNEIDRQMLSLILAEYMPEAKILECGDDITALQRLETGQFDLVVVDLLLGPEPVTPIIELACARKVPVVIMTGAPELAPEGLPLIVKDIDMISRAHEICHTLQRAMEPHA